MTALQGNVFYVCGVNLETKTISLAVFLTQEMHTPQLITIFFKVNFPKMLSLELKV